MNTQKICFHCKFAKTLSTGLLSKKEEREFEKEKEKDTFVLLRENVTLVTGDRYGKCLAGHNEKLLKVYKELGSIPVNKLEQMTDLDMECFDLPETAKILDSMIEKTNEMLALLTNE